MTHLDRIRQWHAQARDTAPRDHWTDVDRLLTHIDRLDTLLRDELANAVRSRDEWEANEQEASRRADRIQAEWHERFGSDDPIAVAAYVTDLEYRFHGLEPIVRDLAAADPRAVYPITGTDRTIHVCTLCGAIEDADDHCGPSCLHRRARAWVAQHPTEEETK